MTIGKVSAKSGARTKTKSSENSSKSLAGKNKKNLILTVDDDPDLLELNVISLSAKGFEVLQAKNGKEAMEWLERKGNEIALVLLDVVMPVMDGFEVLEAIKKNEKFRKIPVVVSSNLDNSTDRETALALGAKDFFEKVKVTPGKVAERVKAIVEG